MTPNETGGPAVSSTSRPSALLARTLPTARRLDGVL